MANRIYLVKNGAGTGRLIEASSKTAALSYAVTTTLSVQLATQHELVTLIAAGVEVESADKDAESSGA